jgi:hypothetical protein|tara:strand:- start:600 stop:920 length:321 start_codon:yes stop_codon:yes gene_type:complete
MVLYIQKPEYHLPDREPGNLAVIEGEPVCSKELFGFKPDKPNQIKVTGPFEYASRFQSVLLDFFQEVNAGAGPARMVSNRATLNTLIENHAVKPNPSLLKKALKNY